MYIIMYTSLINTVETGKQDQVGLISRTTLEFNDNADRVAVVEDISNNPQDMLVAIITVSVMESVVLSTQGHNNNYDSDGVLNKDTRAAKITFDITDKFRTMIDTPSSDKVEILLDFEDEVSDYTVASVQERGTAGVLNNLTQQLGYENLRRLNASPKQLNFRVSVSRMRREQTRGGKELVPIGSTGVLHAGEIFIDTNSLKEYPALDVLNVNFESKYVQEAADGSGVNVAILSINTSLSNVDQAVDIITYDRTTAYKAVGVSNEFQSQLEYSTWDWQSGYGNKAGNSLSVAVTEERGPSGELVGYLFTFAEEASITGNFVHFQQGKTVEGALYCGYKSPAGVARHRPHLVSATSEFVSRMSDCPGIPVHQTSFTFSNANKELKDGSDDQHAKPNLDTPVRVSYKWNTTGQGELNAARNTGTGQERIKYRFGLIKNTVGGSSGDKEFDGTNYTDKYVTAAMAGTYGQSIDLVGDVSAAWLTTGGNEDSYEVGMQLIRTGVVGGDGAPATECKSNISSGAQDTIKNPLPQPEISLDPNPTVDLTTGVQTFGYTITNCANGRQYEIFAQGGKMVGNGDTPSNLYNSGLFMSVDTLTASGETVAGSFSLDKDADGDPSGSLHDIAGSGSNAGKWGLDTTDLVLWVRYKDANEGGEASTPYKFTVKSKSDAFKIYWFATPTVGTAVLGLNDGGSGEIPPSLRKWGNFVAKGCIRQSTTFDIYQKDATGPKLVRFNENSGWAKSGGLVGPVLGYGETQVGTALNDASHAKYRPGLCMASMELLFQAPNDTSLYKANGWFKDVGGSTKKVSIDSNKVKYWAAPEFVGAEWTIDGSGRGISLTVEAISNGSVFNNSKVLSVQGFEMLTLDISANTYAPPGGVVQFWSPGKNAGGGVNNPVIGDSTPAILAAMGVDSISPALVKDGSGSDRVKSLSDNYDSSGTGTGDWKPDYKFSMKIVPDGSGANIGAVGLGDDQTGPLALTGSKFMATLLLDAYTANSAFCVSLVNPTNNLIFTDPDAGGV
jgi:hypothetical protein